MQLGKVRAAQQLVKGKEGIVSQRDPETALNRAQRKRDHRSDRWSPKPTGFCEALLASLAADRLAAAAGLMLALHWPFGHWPLDPWPLRRRSRRTPVTLGIGRYRHSSLLARDGARDHSINRAIQRSTKAQVPPRRETALNSSDASGAVHPH